MTGAMDHYHEDDDEDTDELELEKDKILEAQDLGNLSNIKRKRGSDVHEEEDNFVHHNMPHEKAGGGQT